MHTSPTKIGFSVVAVGASLGAYISGSRLSESNSYPSFTDSNTDGENDISVVLSDAFNQTLESDVEVAEEPSVNDLFESMLSHQRLSSKIYLEDSPLLGEEQVGEIKSPESSITVVTKKVGSGDSFIAIAKSAGADSAEITNILYRSGIEQSLFSLRKGQVLEFTFTESQLLSVSFLTGGLTYILLEVNDDGIFSKSEQAYPVTEVSKSVSFSITTSLSRDATRQGLTAQEILKIENVLKHQVNFSRLPAGATIEAIYERSVANNRVVSSTLKAVRVNVRSQNHVAIRYEENGEVGYFDKEGVSVLPSFMRHPVKNPVISSRFDLNRKHPILKTVRPHYGTDYAHMRGTPVLAISDARVKYIGTQRGYGNLVILSHPAGIETLSAHLDRFPKGLKMGDRVKKGDVVGYVGKTGLSTGYHLHFELIIDGEKVDSLKAELPTVERVKNTAAFSDYVSKLSSGFN